MELQTETRPLEIPAMRMDTSSLASKTVTKTEPIFHVENVNFYYGDKHALKAINLEIAEKKSMQSSNWLAIRAWASVPTTWSM